MPSQWTFSLPAPKADQFFLSIVPRLNQCLLPGARSLSQKVKIWRYPCDIFIFCTKVVNLGIMRWIICLFLLFAAGGVFAQWKDYRLINDGKDTVNRIDQQDRRQREWIVRVERLRGEPGYEEEGEYVDNRKEGEWRIFNLMGDLIGIEQYRWGNKDGLAQYFTINGGLRMEQHWKALNPDKQFDTIQVEDVDKLNTYRTVVVKNEGAALKHGVWKYYDAEDGSLIRAETYVLGKLESNDAVVAQPQQPKEVPKPKEVLEFEQQKGRKKIRYQDGSTL